MARRYPTGHPPLPPVFDGRARDKFGDAILEPLQISEADIQGDSSSSESEFQPLRVSTKRSEHRRSMSNPIPSLADRTKARQNSHGAFPRDLDLFGFATDAAQPSDSKRNQDEASGNKDLATGNCMTCASLVRWPSDKNVYKCTICLTINDVVHPGQSSKGRRRGSSRSREHARDIAPKKDDNLNQGK